MRRIALLILAIGFLVPFFAAAPAHAQATRTWVSGVGDDANPCSRTAPCKTFAGAISKTAVGGEINCLDPGGFGAVTITKSITIDCHEVFGSVLVSGTNAIIINAAAGKVVLRNLNLNGNTTGLKGVSIIAAASVWLEDLMIMQFSQQAIADTRSTAGSLYVTNSTLRNSLVGLGVAATGGTLGVTVENTRAEGNSIGIAAAAGNNVMVKRSNISGNSGNGIEGDGGQITVDDTAIANNGTGVSANSGSGTIRLSNSDIAFNSTGVTVTSGTVLSFGNNRIAGNGSPGTAPTAAGGAAPALGQQ
jgi:hypothetical protein